MAIGKKFGFYSENRNGFINNLYCNVFFSDIFSFFSVDLILFFQTALKAAAYSPCGEASAPAGLRVTPKGEGDNCKPIKAGSFPPPL